MIDEEFWDPVIKCVVWFLLFGALFATGVFIGLLITEGVETDCQRADVSALSRL